MAQGGVFFTADSTVTAIEFSSASDTVWTGPVLDDVSVYLTSLPGDLNIDGLVNSADLDIVREHWNETVTAGDLAMGDATGDGFVGSGDLDTVRANWGQSLLAAAVPEPGVLSLLAMGLFCLVGRFRRS